MDSTSTYLTPIQHQSTFQKAFDLIADPILYAPKVSPSSAASANAASSSSPEDDQMECQPQQSQSELVFPLKDALMLSPMSKARNAGAAGSGGITKEVAKAIVGTTSTKADAASSPKVKKKAVPSSKFKRYPNNQRVLVYAKQDNEEVYMPLHITPPTVQVFNKLFFPKSERIKV